MHPTRYRMLIFGLAMVLIMVWKPRGLISNRQPTAALKKRKKISADMVAYNSGTNLASIYGRTASNPIKNALADAIADGGVWRGRPTRRLTDLF